MIHLHSIGLLLTGSLKQIEEICQNELFLLKFRQDSTIVTPYESWQYYDPNIVVKEQNMNYAANKTKKVAWFVSNCGAKNGRLQYAQELAKYIREKY